MHKQSTILCVRRPAALFSIFLCLANFTSAHGARVPNTSIPAVPPLPLNSKGTVTTNERLDSTAPHASSSTADSTTQWSRKLRLVDNERDAGTEWVAVTIPTHTDADTQVGKEDNSEQEDEPDSELPGTESQNREGDDISDSNSIINGDGNGIERTDVNAAAGGASISKCTIPAAVEPRRVGPLTRQTSASRCAAACRSVP